MANFRLTDGPDLWPETGEDITEAPFVEALLGDDTLNGTDFADTLLGNENQDQILGGNGADVIYGGKGDDTIGGDDDHDAIYGNIGNDFIEGGVGWDTIYGGQNNDSISGQNGDDQIYGNLGDDFLEGGSGQDTIYGGQENDTISGQDGDDELYGNLGDDFIQGGAGTDTIYGGQDNDTISGQDGDDDIYGNKGNDSLEGGEGDDTMYGGQDNDTIFGQDGNDVIFGNLGADLIRAAEGNDLIYAGKEDDTISGGTGEDTIIAGIGDDLIEIAEGDVVSGEIIDGQEGNDVLAVTGSNDISSNTVDSIEEFLLNDGITLTVSFDQADAVVTMSVAEGGTQAFIQVNASREDILASNILDKAGPGIVILDEDGENFFNQIEGTEADDDISPESTDFTTTEGNDEISALGGNDTIFAAGGNDQIDAGDGDDQAWGGLGSDVVVGGAGNDTLGLETEGDAIAGETYDGGDGTDVLLANATNDVSDSTVSNVEVFTLANAVTLTVSLEQAVAATSYNVSETGDIGALQVNSTSENILAANILDKAGIGVAILDENGELVENPDPGDIKDITGSDEDDEITSSVTEEALQTTAGKDQVQGLGGDDTISTVDGDDTVIGGDGNDLITGGNDMDSLEGNAGDDTFFVDAGNVVAGETYSGGDDNDKITVRGDSDFSETTLSGIEELHVYEGIVASVSLDNITDGGVEKLSADTDTPTGVGTVKILSTKTEIDDSNIIATLDIDDNVIVVDIDDNIVFPEINVIQGSPGPDNLPGTENVDLISGLAGNDTIRGLGGNDTIDGGAGVDSLEGGLGNDTFISTAGHIAAGETINGGEGTDNILATGNNDLSGATVTSIEELVIENDANVLASQANIDSGIASVNGNGTIQASGVQQLNLEGVNIGSNITVLDQDGNPVDTGGGGDRNPGNAGDPGDRPLVDELTTESDQFSGTGWFYAPLGNESGIGTVPTLDDGDELDGTGTDDLLIAVMNVTDANQVSRLEVSPVVRNVEQVNIKATRETIYKADNTLGTQRFVSAGSNALVSFTNVQEKPDVFQVQDSSVGLVGTLSASALSGGSDEITIALADVKAESGPQPPDGEGIIHNGIIQVGPVSGNNGYEKVTIDSTKAENLIGNFDDRDSASLREVVITGDKNLTITGTSIVDDKGTPANTTDDINLHVFPGEVQTIDASAFTGNLTLGSNSQTFGDLSNTTNLTFLGGSGDDFIRMGTNALDGNDDLDGRDGIDTVQATFNAAVNTTLKLANIENFYINPQGATTLNLGGNDTFVRIRIDSSDNNLVLADLGNVPEVIELRAPGDAGVDPDLNDLTINFDPAAVTGNTDTITINVNNRGTNLGTEQKYISNPISLGSIEILNLEIEDGNFNESGVANDITTSNLRTFTVTSDSDVYLGNIVSNATNGINRLNASAVKGKLELSSNNIASNSTISLAEGDSLFDATGSAGTNVSIIAAGGNDTITGSGGTNNIAGKAGDDQITGAGLIDTLSGGAGDDIITGLGGADILTGGAGEDQFRYDKIAANNSLGGTLNNIDNISGFISGDDKIALQIGAPVLPGLTLTPTTAFAQNPDINIANANSIAEILGATGGIGTQVPASSAATVQFANVIVGAGSQAGNYLFINDNAAVADTLDLLIQTDSADFVATDFTTYVE